MNDHTEWQEVPEMDNPFEDDPFEEMEKTEPAPAPVQETPAPMGAAVAKTEPSPASPKEDPAAVEAHKRAEFEAAEAKRKAEWDARQAEKHAARQAALDKIKAMNDAQLIEAATQKVGKGTEKLTRRNMKECVCEYIQTLCMEDPEFARLTLLPRKSMVNCFAYISHKAWDYVQDELKASGRQPGRDAQSYGCDVPDGLCYGWAEEYFRDPNAKEDGEKEEKFILRTYPGSHSVKKKAERPVKKKAEPEPAPKPVETKPKGVGGQLTLGDFAA